MGAKIVLSGEVHNIQRDGEVVTFTIDTGPATRHPPAGLRLYGRTRYRVECTASQWERANQEQDEHEAVIDPVHEIGAGNHGETALWPGVSIPTTAR